MILKRPILSSFAALAFASSIVFFGARAAAQPAPPSAPIAPPPSAVTQPPTPSLPPAAPTVAPPAAAPAPFTPTPPPPQIFPPPAWNAPRGYAAPYPSGAELPPPEEHKSHPTGFRVDFKLPANIVTLGDTSNTVVSSTSPVPQLSLGLRTGRLGLLIGFGFARTSLSRSLEEVAFGGGIGSSSSTTSSTQLLAAPTITYDMFQSNDGKVSFYALGAPLFGALIGQDDTNSIFGFQFALGAKVALHENFLLGLEAGPVGEFYNLTASIGESVGIITMYGALVGTFVDPG